MLQEPPDLHFDDFGTMLGRLWTDCGTIVHRFQNDLDSKYTPHNWVHQHKIYNPDPTSRIQNSRWGRWDSRSDCSFCTSGKARRLINSEWHPLNPLRRVGEEILHQALDRRAWILLLMPHEACVDQSFLPFWVLLLSLSSNCVLLLSGFYRAQ